MSLSYNNTKYILSCSGDHTETIDIDYNPEETDYDTLLDIFWKNHNPTSFYSRQYMSAIFYHDEAQKEAAEQSLASQRRKVTTQILEAETFYNAEGWVQNPTHDHIFISYGDK